MSIINTNNPQSLNQYVKSEVDKLTGRYKKSKCKMTLFYEAYKIFSDSYLYSESSLAK